MKRVTLLIVVAAMNVASILPLHAEEAEQRCEIPVAVLDRHGNQWLGLTAENFRGKCLGQSVSIVSAKPDSGPRRVALIVDTSASMFEQEKTCWKVAEDLVLDLTPYNRAMILSLNVRLDQHSGLSNDPKGLGQALHKARYAGYSGPSALYDGVLDVSRECGARWDIGDVVAVITDGSDTASALNLRDATTAIGGAGVRVCFLWTNGGRRLPPGMASDAGSWVRGLAEATGGFVVSADRDGVRSLVSSITQFYRLGLVLPRGIDRSQELELKVVDHDGKELKGVKLVYPHLVKPSLKR